MAVLIETRMGSLKLCEGKCPPRKGCLGRLEGICADFKNPTRNGRLYPLNLWKKVFNESLFKEALENKTLFGELDHPEDRFEPLMTEACVVMTDYRIDEDAGVVYGGFDILDTPKGRILKTILDYGSTVGVSSRGQGDIIESVDGEQVDEDTYDFACFDVVSTPAVEKARQRVAESVKKTSFTESVRRQINDAETVTDLNIIRSVVRSSNLSASEMDNIMESIEDKCNSLQNVDETIVTKPDEQVATGNLYTAKTIRENRELYSCINVLRKKVSAYKHREKCFAESLQANQSTIDELSHKVEQLTKQASLSAKRYGKKISQMEEGIQRDARRSERTLTETTNKVQSLISENSKLQRNLSSEQQLRVRKTEELEQDIEAKQLEINSLLEQVDALNGKVRQLQEENYALSSSHTTEIRRIDDEVDNYSQLLSEAQEKISRGSDEVHKLNESLKKCKEQLTAQRQVNNKLSENLKAYQNSYTTLLADISGIDPNSIYHSIGNNTKPKDVDKLVEGYRTKLDRFNKLGISQTGLLESTDVTISSSAATTDPELERLDKFLGMCIKNT